MVREQLCTLGSGMEERCATSPPLLWQAVIPTNLQVNGMFFARINCDGPLELNTSGGGVFTSYTELQKLHTVTGEFEVKVQQHSSGKYECEVVYEVVERNTLWSDHHKSDQCSFKIEVDNGKLIDACSDGNYDVRGQVLCSGVVLPLQHRTS